MTKKSEVYKCEICGNIVEVIHEAGGQLVCCGQPMTLQLENSVDAAKEKHVPIIKDNKVIVGTIEHPMEEAHYIEWIEIITEHRVYRKHLEPNMEPLAQFSIEAVNISARAYCNKHELWKS